MLRCIYIPQFLVLYLLSSDLSGAFLAHVTSASSHMCTPRFRYQPFNYKKSVKTYSSQGFENVLAQNSKDFGLVTISRTSTSASILRKYIYWIRSFLICRLFSLTLATVKMRSLHLAHNLFLFSRNTMRSNKPPSEIIHHKSIVPVWVSVFELTGHVSMPLVRIKADSSIHASMFLRI